MKISSNLFLRLLDVGVSVGFMCRGSCLCSWMSPLRDGVLGVCGERETVCESHHPLVPVVPMDCSCGGFLLKLFYNMTLYTGMTASCKQLNR